MNEQRSGSASSIAPFDRWLTLPNGTTVVSRNGNGISLEVPLEPSELLLLLETQLTTTGFNTGDSEDASDQFQRTFVKGDARLVAVVTLEEGTEGSVLVLWYLPGPRSEQLLLKDSQSP
jgi:hypothetical protein